MNNPDRAGEQAFKWYWVQNTEENKMRTFHYGNYINLQSEWKFKKWS